MKRLLILLLCTGFISIMSCIQTVEHPNASNSVIIEVVIDQNAQLLFEGLKIEYDDFAKTCSTRISELAGQNIATGDIIVSLEVNEKVDIEIIKGLQSQLRNLEIKTMFYSII